jgi:hypothetical protein
MDDLQSHADSDSESDGSTSTQQSDRPSSVDYEIIKRVQAKPLLWDSRLDGYKDTQLKNVIWSDMAKDMKLTQGKYLVFLTVVNHNSSTIHAEYCFNSFMITTQ